MDKLILLLIAGITTGCIYGLLALGFNLIYNSSGVFNFAQGEYLMVGAISGAVLMEKGLSFPLAALLAVIIVAVVAVVGQLVILRPLQKRNVSMLTMVMATLGSAIVISNLTRVVLGTSQRVMSPFLGDGQIKTGLLVINLQNVVIIAVTLLILTGVWFLNNKTILGLALRASGFNKKAAYLMGINVTNITLLSFFLSGIIAAAAGLLLAPITSAYPTMGIPLTVKGFIATVLGGIGNPYTAILGGLILGILEMFTSGYVSTSLSDIVILAILPLILIVKPSGIFGINKG